MNVTLTDVDPFSPETKPKFLDPNAACTGYPGADETPEFDTELAAWNDPDYTETLPPEGKGPSRGYKERWRAIARLHALGHTNNQIGRKLGYSAAGVSLALKQPFVAAEVERFRQQYETDITARVKECAIDGIERIHGIIRDDREKSAVVLDASKWAVEKATGKPRQEVTVESGTLSTFMEMLKAMQSRGEVIDVSPRALPAVGGSAAAAQPDPLDAWLIENT